MRDLSGVVYEKQQKIAALKVAIDRVCEVALLATPEQMGGCPLEFSPRGYEHARSHNESWFRWQNELESVIKAARRL